MFTTADLTAIIASHPARATATLPTLLTVDGIFTRPSLSLPVFGGEVSGSDPVFVLPKAACDTHGIDIEFELAVGGVNWLVSGKQERNDGMVTLQLQRDYVERLVDEFGDQLTDENGEVLTT